MKNGLKAGILAVAIGGLAACGSAERKVNKAEAKKIQEETKTMQEYKSCVKKAKQDQDKLDLCERLLKANQ
jgi:hypothetical protein